MNKNARIEMLKAMDMICHSFNDERRINFWLAYGIPDGTFTGSSDYGSDVDYLCEDEVFADLMDTFVFICGRAFADYDKEHGQLYFDGIASAQEESAD